MSTMTVSVEVPAAQLRRGDIIRYGKVHHVVVSFDAVSVWHDTGVATFTPDTPVAVTRGGSR